MPSKVLIAEDEARMREVIIMLLSDMPLEFVEAADGRQAIDAFDQETFSLVITDLKLPGPNGMEVLKAIKAKDPEVPVIVNTAFGSIDNAVKAIRAGAFDYVTKPFKEERLRGCVEKALQLSRLTSQVRYLRQEIESEYHFDKIIGHSPQICDILRLAGEVARTDATVLVTGESGTGKELISRAIHFNSERADGPFQPVNCAAIPATLLEAELFGHEQGAFTGAVRRQTGKFEISSGGTLFLDEIGDMSLDVQAKLLRVLEDCTFQRLGGSKFIRADVRIIAATNKDLMTMVHKGQFRQDLYYRINVFPIAMPPLREHRDDIALLADAFVAKFSHALGRKTPQLTATALQRLTAHCWTGNVRELKNVIERAMILCRGSQITSKHLVLHEPDAPPLDKADLDKVVAVLMDNGGINLADLEIRLVKRAMQLADNNVSRAARLLGLTRPTLRYRLEKLGLDGAGQPVRS